MASSDRFDCRSSRSASVRVSRLQPGEKIVVPVNWCAVVAQIGAGSLPDSRSTLRDRTEVKVLSRPGEVCSFGAGELLHMASEPANEVLIYEVPNASFRDFASARPSVGIDSFAIPTVLPDVFLELLSRSVLPLLKAGTIWSTEFGGYVAISLYFHLFETYGTRKADRERAIGGLSPRNKAKVEQTIRSFQGICVSIESMSRQCGLSSRQFARAFQQSYGMPFYKFQLGIRIQRARELLIKSDMPIGEIALTLGYADQATFTEGFSRAVGAPPGRFRRQHALPM